MLYKCPAYTPCSPNTNFTHFLFALYAAPNTKYNALTIIISVADLTVTTCAAELFKQPSGA